MRMELTKNQKKEARELIRIALERECNRFLSETDSFMQETREAVNPHERYLELYGKVKKFDKYLARRYDGLTGSAYFPTLAGLCSDGVLTAEDMESLDDGLRNKLLHWLKIAGGESE